MNIYGDKVVLRAISLKDKELLLNLINDPDTEEMLGGASFPVSDEAQEQWISSQRGREDVLRCIVAEKNDMNKGLGTIILSNIDRKNGVAQVHLKMDATYGRGRGYGTDSLKAIIKYAFEEMRLNCIYAEVLEYNIRSQKLFEKCGFEKEGLLRHRVYKKGNYINVISYSIINR